MKPQSQSLISTFSGRQIDLLQPEPDQIHLEDIAHGLAQTCRFAGQCPVFYSVAQHSVVVSQLVEPEWAMHGLLHDASEAFMGDLHTGLKRLLPDYKKLENGVLTAIFKHFGLSGRVLKPDPVEVADKQALVLEIQNLGMVQTFEYSGYLPEVKIQPLGIDGAKRAFIQRYNELKAQTVSNNPA